MENKYLDFIGEDEVKHIVAKEDFTVHGKLIEAGTVGGKIINSVIDPDVKFWAPLGTTIHNTKIERSDDLLILSSNVYNTRLTNIHGGVIQKSSLKDIEIDGYIHGVLFINNTSLFNCKINYDSGITYIHKSTIYDSKIYKSQIKRAIIDKSEFNDSIVMDIAAYATEFEKSWVSGPDKNFIELNIHNSDFTNSTLRVKEIETPAPTIRRLKLTHSSIIVNRLTGCLSKPKVIFQTIVDDTSFDFDEPIIIVNNTYDNSNVELYSNRNGHVLFVNKHLRVANPVFLFPKYSYMTKYSAITELCEKFTTQIPDKIRFNARIGQKVDI